MLHRDFLIREQFNIFQHCKIYVDTGANRTLAQVKTKALRPLSSFLKDVPVINPKNKALWLTFTIKNNLDTTLNIWLYSGRHDIIQLFQDNSEEAIFSAGFSEKTYRDALGQTYPNVLPISLTPNMSKTYWVRLTDVLQQISFQEVVLYTSKSYLQSIKVERDGFKIIIALNIASLGIILFIGIFSLFQFFSGGNKSYLWYSIYLIFWMFSLLRPLEYNSNLRLVSDLIPNYFFFSELPLALLIQLSYLKFVDEFLDAQANNPSLHHLIKVNVYGLCIFLVINILLIFLNVKGTIATNVYLFIKISLIVSYMFVLWRIFRNNTRLSKYIGTGSIFLILGVVMSIVMLFAKKPGFWFTPSVWAQFGLLVEILFFAIALGIKQLTKEIEYNQSQKELIQQLQANKELQNLLNIELGKQVALEKERADLNKRIAQVEMSALRAQMNPHFIFNCLNSIHNFTFDNDSENASIYLTKFSKLIRLVLENSRSERITLQNELAALALYIELESLRFKEKVQYAITVDTAIDTKYIKIPPLLLQPYVENAIWHGLLHKKEGGIVTIDVKMLDESNLCIIITDNGIGRERASLLQSKTAIKHKSFGMQITFERINMINELYNTKTKIQIIDLHNENNEPCGTKVILEIPF